MFLFCIARYPALNIHDCHDSSSNSFIYLAEKAFSEPSMGQIILLASFIFFGLLTLILMLLLLMFWWIPVLKDTKKVLEVLLLVFPPYALGTGCLCGSSLIELPRRRTALPGHGTDQG